MIKEHDRVVLKSPIPNQGLEAGDVGTVVHVYKDGEAADGIQGQKISIGSTRQ
jgi:uncharacterized protein DUF4926